MKIKSFFNVCFINQLFFFYSKAGKDKLHQLSSGMRRTMSLDAIIGPYLQGHWPKEPDAQCSPPRKDKSTQVSSKRGNKHLHFFQKNEWNAVKVFANHWNFRVCLLLVYLMNQWTIFNKTCQKVTVCKCIQFSMWRMGLCRVILLCSFVLFFFTQWKKLLKVLRVEGRECPVLAQLLHSVNCSHENSPWSQLTRPFLAAPILSAASAGSRRCSLAAHILHLLAVFQFLQLICSSVSV